MCQTTPAPDPARHRPVLLGEVLEALKPHDGGIYVDGTFGAGGYSSAILEAAQTRVFAIDRDPDALAEGAGLVDRFAGRLTLIEGRFADMSGLLDAYGITEVDGVTLDVGVSSMQLDRGERGFSFGKDGPLDMRMSQSGLSAADVVNEEPEANLKRIIKVLGEERQAHQIARAIANRRKEQPFERTRDLADLIERVVGPKRAHDRIHPATRTFQALRIYVNDELQQLALALAAAEALLRPGGRLAVVSFHSLEDRIVKRFLAARCGHVPNPSRHAPAATGRLEASFVDVARGGIVASEAECEANPRARSARLRAAQRTTAPAHHLEPADLGMPTIAMEGD